jgi:Na+-driven multidrug efflux pump
MFQALGNAVPPMLSSLSRIVLISIPIIVLSQQPGFSLKTIWYISVCGTALQMVANLALLQREFHRRFTPQLATDQPSLSA